MQQTNEQKNSKIFLVMDNGASIELQVINKLHIREIVQIARQEYQKANQVLKIFKENQLLRSSMIIESNDLQDGQVFQAQTLKKQQSLFYKRANSEPQEIIVEIEKQKISDVIQQIKKDVGISENKLLQAKLKDQILDQDRYFYEYKNILYDHIAIQEGETPNDLQIPIQNKEENQQISLKISYQNKIIQILCSYNNTIDEVCMKIQKKDKTTQIINLYQNYKKLNKNSILANYLIVSQANLMASIQQESYHVIVKYQNLDQQLTIYSKYSINKIQEAIRQLFVIPQNINLSLYLNNMELDEQNNLEEYFIQDQQTIVAQIVSKKYSIILPELKKEIKVQIENINISIDDIVSSIREQLNCEHINFCAYEGKTRLNMKININLVPLKTNIITLWKEEQNYLEKEVTLFINFMDLKQFHEIQITQDQQIKSIERIIQEKNKITDNLQFYYNKQKICSEYTIKNLGIFGQIQIECQIIKKQYDIQVRYKGIIKNLTVWRSWLVSQLVENSRLLFQINKDNLMVIQDQIILNMQYELDNYLIDEIIDICEEGLLQFNLKVLMYNDTVSLNVIINYQSKIIDLYNNLNDKYRGRKFYVYYDRKKQQKKKLLREFDLNNLVAGEINNAIKFDLYVQDQHKNIIFGQIVNPKQIIGDFLSQLLLNCSRQRNKELKLAIQSMVLDQGKRFSYYLIQEHDQICIEIPDQIYQFQVDGSQINCQLLSQNLQQFQEQKQTLTFQIRFVNKVNQKYQITASVKSKLADLLQRLNFTNFDINNIQVHVNNQILDISKSLDSLGIKMNDMLEAFIEQQILLLQISINKKYPKEQKINTLWSVQQLIDFICQKEKLQTLNCKLHYKDKEIQNNIYLKNLKLKDGDLLDIFYKQRQLLRQLSVRQMTQQTKQQSKSPYTKQLFKKAQQKSTKGFFCQCGPQSGTCRCGKYGTIFTQQKK